MVSTKLVIIYWTEATKLIFLWAWECIEVYGISDFVELHLVGNHLLIAVIVLIQQT